jgi:hypothetical protein
MAEGIDPDAIEVKLAGATAPIEAACRASYELAQIKDGSR